jgi:flagellar hook-length control protein FliK
LLYCCQHKPTTETSMTIAIVSALPKSAPPPTTNIAGEAGSAGSEQDFALLLFGQLNAIQPSIGSILGTTSEFARLHLAQPSVSSILGTTSESAAEDSEEWNTNDNAANASLNLLAALAQAPLEQRSDVALPEKTPSTGLTGTSQELPTNESPADEIISMAGRTIRDQETSQAMPIPANEPTAKFAALPNAVRPDTALPDTAPYEQSTSVREPTGLSAMAAVTPGAPARAGDASPTTPTIPLSTPLHDRGWNDDFAQKVSWIAGQRYQSAELTLNPPALGNIEISLKFDSDKSNAVATFVSSNAEVRETIETALPRLREMLAGVGIELGQAHVSAESFRQTAGNGRNPSQGAPRSEDDMAILASDPQADRIAAPTVDRGRGLVDMFV